MDGGTAVAVWLVLALVLVGVELATLAFVSLYLAVGAIAAAVAAATGAGFEIQVVTFAIASVASLVLTRKPLLRALGRTPLAVSNAPTVVGKRALVTVPVAEGPGQRGQVRVGTEFWSARSEDERAIADGATVEVVSIEGVSLVIRPVAAEG
jgi:membrane protein implicated in regulation of membrane protease activity